MSEPWTVRRVTTWTRENFATRGIASPRLDAELLVAHALGIDRVRLYMDLDRPLLPPELDAIRALVARRQRREPVAYLLGRREFYGRDMIVTPDVLIPRPDTETLIELALARLPVDSAARVLDVGTGSGCIAVTLLAERPRLTAVATDLSPPALEIARRNAEKHAVADRLELFQGDLLAALPAGVAPFDLVVANPPYIASTESGELEPDVRDHEPSLALFGGEDGLAVIRRFAAGLPGVLAPGGRALMEIGADQGVAAAALLRAAGLAEVGVRQDLGGRDRVIEASRP